MGNVRKVGVVALVTALVVVLGVLHPAGHTPPAEAGLGAPGGIAALPSAAPAVPGLNNQQVPAIIGTGQPGIVTVFCFGQLLPVHSGPCDGAITFTMERLYPQNSGPPALTFDANGDNTLVVTDNGGADMDAAVGVVTVRVNAAAATTGNTKGVNEIVLVTATDSSGGGGCSTCGGDSRSVQIVVVDTILAFGPTGPLGTAAQEQPLLVSYHCDVTGRAPLVAVTEQAETDPDLDGAQGLDDMYDGLYGEAFSTPGAGLGYGSNSSSVDINPRTGLPDLDLPDVWCGGNTAALYDDYVSFETDLGIFSMSPVAQALKNGASQLAQALGVFFPPVVSTDCDQGRSVNVFDVDALYYWFQWLSQRVDWPSGGITFKGGCDADGWRNGVVTTFLLGNGDVGTATITAQQGGGLGPPARTINATFVGEPLLSLYLEAPATMGVEGGSFKAVVVDSGFRPVGNVTVSCSLDPLESGLIIWPQTGTTGPVSGDLPGMLMVKIIPTGKAVAAGGTLTLTCRMDRQRSVVAVGVVKLEAFESESVKLVAGCNPLAATWPDATLIDTVVKGVAPPEALDAIWVFDPETGAWQGFSAAAPEASDLASVNQLEAIFVCMNAPGTISRPKI